MLQAKSQIRINPSLVLLRTLSQQQQLQLEQDTQEMAYEIYKLKGWRFDTSMLRVSVGYTPAVMSHKNKVPRRWFQFSYTGTNAFERRCILATKRTFKKRQKNPDDVRYLDYHSYDHMYSLWKSGRLHEIIKE